MEIDATNAAQFKKLQKELEDIAGKEFNLSMEKLINFTFPVASHDYGLFMIEIRREAGRRCMQAVVSLAAQHIIVAARDRLLSPPRRLQRQALAVLQSYVAEQGAVLSPIAAAFADHLRYGVPTSTARDLMARGLRHRVVAFALGAESAFTSNANIFGTPESIARELLQDTDSWSLPLGTLVYQRAVADVRTDWPAT